MSANARAAAEQAFVDHYLRKYASSQHETDAVPRRMIEQRVGIWEYFLAGYWSGAAAQNGAQP